VRKIAIIGTGCVGLVTGSCFAELGNHVVCIDNDERRFAALQAGRPPFYEPGLAELMRRNLQGGRLSFCDSIAAGCREAEVVFIAVGTPMGIDGQADLSFVRAAAVELAQSLDGPKVIVNKSTVPVETGDLVAAIVREHRRAHHEVEIVSNPEFLRAGSAVADFMCPDRIVIGSSSRKAIQLMRDIYAGIKAPILETDLRTAEMIKYTANSFLATKISFINEIASVCEELGIDVTDVVAGAGADKRIGKAFFSAGLGFGGSCLPKDLHAMSGIAKSHGIEVRILQAVQAVNESQITRMCDRLSAVLNGLEGRRIGVLGLSFKPNTDDVRDSPAIALIGMLLERGATVAAHDPAAVENAREVLDNRVVLLSDCYEASNDADAIVIATDWNEYKQIDLAVLAKLMAGNIFCDGRNLYDPSKVTDAGFVYLGVGRQRRVPATGISPDLRAH
jgi:UDPglucose 6-dehydrogenase